jgi:hypothetical protein
MPQSKLLVHPAQSADGVGHRITPASAGWRYVGFETRTLKQGAKSKLEQGARHRGRLRFWNNRRAGNRFRRPALVGLPAPA